MDRPAARLTRFWLADRSHLILLVCVATTIFILGPLHQLELLGHLAVGVAFALLLLSGIAATARSRAMAVFFSGVVLITQVVYWASALSAAPALHVPDLIASFIATGLLATILLRQAFREGPVTHGRIFAAVNAYLLIGLMFALLYSAIGALAPNAFSTAATPPHVPLTVTSPFVYFSFVTLTTVGYGDIQPIHPAARSLATLEAVIGQLFPAVLLARLVSLELYYRQRRFEREQADLDRQAVAREIARHLKSERQTGA
ncbi:MAG: ion channel [Candidatus Binatia bacterium]